MQKQSDAFLFVEKYRPSKIDDCILPVSVKTELAAYIASGEINNMIFSGTAGVGKTSVAKAIANELNADLLYINMSSDTGIDVVRNQIVQFASTASFEGNLKIIIGDECLSENERVRIGSVDSWVGVPLKELQFDTPYPLVSFNMETGEFENDVGAICSDREDDLYEIHLDDGSSIIANAVHPFICIDVLGNVCERSINDGFDSHQIVKSK